MADIILPALDQIFVKHARKEDERNYADIDTFRVVLYYSIAILALPISTFFTTKVLLFDKIIGTDTVTSNVYATVCAILMLHGALAVFIFKAYSDDGEKKKLDKAD